MKPIFGILWFLVFAAMGVAQQRYEDLPVYYGPMAQPKANDSSPARVPPPIRTSLGDVLQNPRIISFNGENFEVEHAGGVARVAWDRMPEAWRAGYTRGERPAGRESAPALRPAEIVVVAGRVLGAHKDGKYWVITGKPASAFYRNHTLLSYQDQLNLPRQIPLKNGRVLIPIAQVPADWRRDTLVIFKTRLVASAANRQTANDNDFLIDGVIPWDHQMIQFFWDPEPDNS